VPQIAGESEKPAPDSDPAFPRFSFLMTVFNGMPFLEFALRSVYEFANEIIVVEGAVEECRFAATESGGSTDGTVECLRHFPDPQGKLRLVQGLWPDQGAMREEALRHVTGDYVWLLNADEVFRHGDLEKVRRLVRERPQITQINFIPDHLWKGFDDVVVSPHFFEAEAHSRRVFQFAPGARFVAHHAPALLLPGSTQTTEEQHCVSGDETRALGIAPCRCGLVVESRVAQRIELEHRCGRGRQGGVDLHEWLRECYGKWTPLNREEIERRHPVWPGGGGSHTQPFRGEHPEALRAFIRDWQLRAPAPTPAGGDETRITSIIGGETYLRLTLEAWKHLQLDAPLLQRRAVIEQCLAGGTGFWNRPVALAFLADRLKPASYLEVGVRAGGAFAQVLAHAPVREAVGIDLWAGTYADLPNTRGLAAGQLAATLRAAGHECAIDLRQGECQAELRRLRRQGRTFDLISVDEDQIGTGAHTDLEILLQLLNPCGAILIEGLILPGRAELLTVVRQFAQAHPDLCLFLNTRQDNGTAILLRGVSVEELCPELGVAEPAPARGIRPADASPQLSC
jgi:predicted O-methyltransferase YrrM